LIIREARAEAERIVEEARAEVRRMEDQIAALDRGRRAFLAQLRVMVERQLSEITAAEQSPASDNGSREGAAGSAAWMGSLVKE
jgi:cell division septum initiation protein DivIVA